MLPDLSRYGRGFISPWRVFDHLQQFAYAQMILTAQKQNEEQLKKELLSGTTRNFGTDVGTGR